MGGVAFEQPHVFTSRAKPTATVPYEPTRGTGRTRTPIAPVPVRPISATPPAPTGGGGGGGCGGCGGNAKAVNGSGGPGTAADTPMTPGTSAGITNPVPPTTASIGDYAGGATSYPVGPNSSGTTGGGSARATPAVPARAAQKTRGPALSSNDIERWALLGLGAVVALAALKVILD